jgi:hypothetical protein
LKPLVSRLTGSSAVGEPLSHSAHSSPPAIITEVLAALASSGPVITEPLPGAVPKPGVITALAAVSLAALHRVDEAGRHPRLAAGDLELADQAVAVEPVADVAARPAELGRAVAEQGPGQVRRRLAVQAGHAGRRDVGLDVGQAQGPVASLGIRRGPRRPRGQQARAAHQGRAAQDVAPVHGRRSLVQVDGLGGRAGLHREGGGLEAGRTHVRLGVVREAVRLHRHAEGVGPHLAVAVDVLERADGVGPGGRATILALGSASAAEAWATRAGLPELQPSALS